MYPHRHKGIIMKRSKQMLQDFLIQHGKGKNILNVLIMKFAIIIN